MSATELTFTFDCEGSELVGMVHLPEVVRSRGLLTVVAGGPQYRGGVCRMQVQTARHLATVGVPTMRFDYRGLGDAEGEFRGFRDVSADIAAAVQAFKSRVPQLGEIVLWGGCDAASAIMLNAWRYPEVTGIVLGNPWVHSQESGDTVAMQHFSQRLRDRDFWVKLARLDYNPLPALATIARSAASRLGGRRPAAPDGDTDRLIDNPDAPFVPRMCEGLSRFHGDLLLLMSERSLLSREFDVLVEGSAQWQAAMRSPRHVARQNFAEADQAFSDIQSRLELRQVLARWLADRTTAGASAHGARRG